MKALWSTGNHSISLNFYGEDERFWGIRQNISGKEWIIGAPAFEVDGQLIPAVLDTVSLSAMPKLLHNGTTEYRLSGQIRGMEDLQLDWIVRIPDSDNPVVRFCYELKSGSGRRLTKQTGIERLRYATISLDDQPKAKELRFAEFMEMVHSFCLTERALHERHFNNGEAVMGPIITAGDGIHQSMFGYEHGSQVPDAFIRFSLTSDRKVVVEAVKGNYYDGCTLDSEQPYRTVWLQAAFLQGGEDELAAAYRNFVLHHMTLNTESRKPYIFYNTWNYQERNRNWYGKKYLEEMNLERMLKEIDAAHEIGIDVFVIDTGWYEKTGDWRVSRARFPDELKQVKERLDHYGMKLGLWFNPTVAAISSGMLEKHQDCVMSWNGEKSKPRGIWETEASVSLCLVSRYADAFAEELIRLVREVGVTYFKWDAIDQYGCNDPSHDHGNESNSLQDRADSYAFKQVQAMTRIVDQLCAACPEAIVDFDITEGHRSVGLAFMSAGKYFLINNGPYFHNYNVPINMDKDNWNLFFFPGPARGWVCRTPLGYDKWFPSVLFLTHYLPDEPRDNQLMSLGSLILGHNGIWGDLPAVSGEGKSLMNQVLSRYKQIRDDITESNPVREGEVGGVPEIHEKISAKTGKGTVVLFSATAGTYRYITQHKPDGAVWHTDGVSVTCNEQGYAVIEAEFGEPSARIVLFGVN
jgi:alpha-galactosidase